MVKMSVVSHFFRFLHTAAVHPSSGANGQEETLQDLSLGQKLWIDGDAFPLYFHKHRRLCLRSSVTRRIKLKSTAWCQQEVITARSSLCDAPLADRRAQVTAGLTRNANTG